MFDSKCFNSAMGTVIKLAKDTLTCFSLQVLHFPYMVSTYGHQNCCCGLCHMENGGLGRETDQSVFGQFYDSPMAELKRLLSNIIVRWMSTIHLTKMLDSKLFTSLPCMVTVINCPMTLLMCFSVKPSIFHMAHTMTAILISMCTMATHLSDFLSETSLSLSHGIWNLSRFLVITR